MRRSLYIQSSGRRHRATRGQSLIFLMQLNQFIPRVRYVGARRTPHTLRLAGGRGLFPRVPGSGMKGGGSVSAHTPQVLTASFSAVTGIRGSIKDIERCRSGV